MSGDFHNMSEDEQETNLVNVALAKSAPFISTIRSPWLSRPSLWMRPPGSTLCIMRPISLKHCQMRLLPSQRSQIRRKQLCILHKIKL